MSAGRAMIAPGILGRPWTADEEALVRAEYRTLGARSLAAKLGRSFSAVCHRAARLGLQWHTRWTGADDQHLRSEWGEKSVTAIARSMGRTTLAIYERAKILGLTGSLPEGYESLTDARERTGFGSSQIRRICEAHGVAIRPVPSRPRGRRAYRFLMVDAFELDEAIAEWMKRESLNAAARRHGVKAKMLRTALLAVGVQVPERRSKTEHWRLTEDEVARAVEWIRGTEHVTDAARRLGIYIQTLSVWLEVAGLRQRGAHTRLRKADIDRVVRERLGRPGCRAPAKVRQSEAMRGAA